MAEMRAFVVDNFGDSGEIRLLPVPEPAPGEVRIQVKAAGINPIDWKIMQGFMKDMAEHCFPLIPGRDASGVVDAVGSDVDKFKVGDKVFGSSGKAVQGEGPFAEFATMSARMIAYKPEMISHALAASLPVPALTAKVALDAADVENGDTVLVVGGAGGVGSFTIQLAALRNTRVITVASGKNSKYVRELGAAEAIDYTSGDVYQLVQTVAPEGLDAIIDLVSDSTMLTHLSGLVKEAGHVVSAVGAADVDELAKRDISGVNIFGQVSQDGLTEIADLLVTGKLKAPPIREYSLDQTTEALEESKTGHVRGKLVITNP